MRILLLIALALPAFAANWYVDPDGSPTGAGTIEDPRTFSSVCGTNNNPWASVNPGDTVWLLDGTYIGLTTGSWGSHPCWLSGTLNMDETGCDARVTIRAVSFGWSAILDNATNYGPQQLTLFGDCVDVILTRVTNSYSTTRSYRTYSSDLVINQVEVASNVGTVTLASTAPYTLTTTTAVKISGATVDPDLNSTGIGVQIASVTSQTVFTIPTTNVADGTYNESTLRLAGYLQFYSCYPNCRVPGVTSQGKLNRFIAGMIDNTGQAFTAETNTDGSSLYDTFVLYTGWQGVSRGNGHNAYIQNANSTRKVLQGNAFLWGTTYPLHLFGVSGATRYVDFDDNVTYANGFLADRFSDNNGDGIDETNNGRIGYPNLIAGPDPLQLRVRNNVAYNPDCGTPDSDNLAPSSGDTPTDNLTLTGNYSQGCSPVDWSSGDDPTNSTASGNTWCGTLQSHVSTYLSSDTKLAYGSCPELVKEYWSTLVPEVGMLTVVNAAGSTIDVTLGCTPGMAAELRNEMNPSGAAVQTVQCGVETAVSLTYSGSMLAVAGQADLPYSPDTPASTFRTFSLRLVDGEPVSYTRRSGSSVLSGGGVIR